MYSIKRSCDTGINESRLDTHVVINLFQVMIIEILCLLVLLHFGRTTICMFAMMTFVTIRAIPGRISLGIEKDTQDNQDQNARNTSNDNAGNPACFQSVVRRRRLRVGVSMGSKDLCGSTVVRNSKRFSSFHDLHGPKYGSCGRTVASKRTSRLAHPQELINK